MKSEFDINHGPMTHGHRSDSVAPYISCRWPPVAAEFCFKPSPTRHYSSSNILIPLLLLVKDPMKTENSTHYLVATNMRGIGKTKGGL